MRLNLESNMVRICGALVITFSLVTIGASTASAKDNRFDREELLVSGSHSTPSSQSHSELPGTSLVLRGALDATNQFPPWFFNINSLLHHLFSFLALKVPSWDPSRVGRMFGISRSSSYFQALPQVAFSAQAVHRVLAAQEWNSALSQVLRSFQSRR